MNISPSCGLLSTLVNYKGEEGRGRQSVLVLSLKKGKTKCIFVAKQNQNTGKLEIRHNDSTTAPNHKTYSEILRPFEDCILC